MTCSLLFFLGRMAVQSILVPGPAVRSLNQRGKLTKRSTKSLHIPIEIILEICKWCSWHDRFTLSQISSRWRIAACEVLIPKAYNLSRPTSLRLLQSCSTFHAHVIFPRIRLVRNIRTFSLEAVVLQNEISTDDFPCERKLCHCPASMDSAMHPPIKSLRLRFQYQTNLREIVLLDKLKPEPSYRFWVTRIVGGQCVTVEDICRCICKCLNADRYLKE